jgi:hypothetical protein
LSLGIETFLTISLRLKEIEKENNTGLRTNGKEEV